MGGRPPIFALLIVLLGAWQRADAVDFSTVEFAGRTFTVCRVDVHKEHLDLFHRDEHNQPFKRFDRLVAGLQPKGRKLVFA